MNGHCGKKEQSRLGEIGVFVQRLQLKASKEAKPPHQICECHVPKDFIRLFY
jgi:hypothetical protein